MTNKVSDLSAHLFWEYDTSKLDWEKNNGLIIQRVLEYGLWLDWQLIKEKYGKDYIKEKVIQLRSLDDVTLSFLCLIFNLKLEDFKCYKLRQSNPHYWNY